MAVEHFDVLIVGAGLSGIGAGCFLQAQCPRKSYAILEARDAIGGTWDLFRYPGIRSDSDMFTLGYSFRPWKEAKAIADGPSILRYVRETARELGVDGHIRFQHRVASASWSSAENLWTVQVELGPAKTKATYRCRFLYACGGYYSYEKGYTPDYPGLERFRGQLIHPQAWPEALDYQGKRVVVIGSGATAMTLVPALAEKAAHVTMLQRSPTYIASRPAEDKLANWLRRLLPARPAHRLIRAKNILLSIFTYWLCRRFPKLTRRLLMRTVAKELPAGFDLQKHFAPAYNPWDQRVCLVPDGDLFQAIRAGKVSVETEGIKSFTASGIALENGRELEADIVVTATGLTLLAIGGIELCVDGRKIEPGESYTYKGLMLGNVPNFAFCVGYTNASWTLRADLSSGFVCRLLNHLDEQGYKVCLPKLDAARISGRPLLDLKSGYVARGAAQLPKQGSEAPWYLRQNYLLDRLGMELGDLRDDVLEFR